MKRIAFRYFVCIPLKLNIGLLIIYIKQRHAYLYKKSTFAFCVIILNQQ